MKPVLLFILGTLLLLSAFWGGSWALTTIPVTDWRAFPSFMTACIIGAAGVAITVCGASLWGRK